MSLRGHILTPEDLHRLRTRDNPPVIETAPPEHITRREKVCKTPEPWSKGYPWCDELSEDGTYCELIASDCKTCQRSGKYRQFLADMNSRCPLRKW